MLVEKPLSLTSHDCFQLAAMSQQTGLKVQVGYVLRFSESFWYFRDQLRNFGLQNVYLVDVLAESYFPLWRPNVHYADTVSAQAMLGGGVLRELSHELDYLVNLFGRIQLESAQLSRSLNLKTDVETRAEIVALAGQDIQVRVKLDMCSSNEARYCRVKFKSGHELVWDIVGQTVETRLNNRQLEKRIFLDYREAWFLRQFQTALGSSSWWNEVPSLDEGLEVLRLIDEIREVAPIDSRQ